MRPIWHEAALLVNNVNPFWIIFRIAPQAVAVTNTPNLFRIAANRRSSEGLVADNAKRADTGMGQSTEYGMGNIESCCSCRLVLLDPNLGRPGADER
jgi:hypothetical protein